MEGFVKREMFGRIADFPVQSLCKTHKKREMKRIIRGMLLSDVRVYAGFYSLYPASVPSSGT